jgi:uncharacterized membrane protein
MNRLNRMIWKLFFALACLSVPAGATIVQSLSLEEMSRKADVIVHGRVVEQATAWNETRSRIYTVTTIEVQERLKGLGASSIRVRQLGGTVDGLTQSIVGNARLVVGEEVVVFLNRDEAKDLHYVVGMAQGKYAVDRSTPVPTIRHDLAGLALARIQEGQLAQLVETTPQPGAALTLDGLKARVADALKTATP